MKKIIFLIMLILSALIYSAETTHVEVTTGEHKGWYKLLNYANDNKYDVYFQISKNSSITSQNYEVIPNYKSVNLKEKITVNVDGTKVTRTRKEWYDILWKVTEGQPFAIDILEREYPGITTDYYNNNLGFDDGIIEKYIATNFNSSNTPVTQANNNDYCKNENLSKKDAKQCAKLAEQEYLENMTGPVNVEKPKKKKGFWDNVGDTVGGFLNNAATSIY